MKLDVVDADLAACVSCGLCLPHCPTYRVTGEEVASPRGRIAAMRRVHLHGDPADEAFVAAMDACVQCRGCEPACPSSVPFGRLMTGARTTLAQERQRYQPRWRRAGYRMLTHHRLLLGLSSVAAVAQRLRLVPSSRLGLPPLPLRRPRLEGVVPAGREPDAWLFTGCVMDAWQRPVHQAVIRVMAATGARVAAVPMARGAGCCGALHVHAGLADHARRLARRVIAAVPGEAPVVVDSAGCGAALREYGHLLGTPAAKAFSARVIDVHAWLVGRASRLPPPRRVVTEVVAVQDPCHLRHVQRAHQHVRTVLGPYVDALVELDDEGLCCGAGGAYAVLEPDLAGPIRERKLAAIARSGAVVVASANPGCAMHLAAAGVRVRHPVELIDDSIRGRRLGGG